MRRNIFKKIHPFHILKKRSGFTLIELTVALILLGILVLISFFVYTNYLNKAKVTLAENVLHNARDNLTMYNIDNGKYPNLIDFDDCIDENNRAVFSPSCCDQIRKDLSSIEYNQEPDGYTIRARAMDAQQTLITVTPQKITK